MARNQAKTIGFKPSSLTYASGTVGHPRCYSSAFPAALYWDSFGPSQLCCYIRSRRRCRMSARGGMRPEGLDPVATLVTSLADAIYDITLIFQR